MSGINDVDYTELCKVLFAVDRVPLGGLSIEFKEVDDKFYIATSRDIVVSYRELTATQYKEATA